MSRVCYTLSEAKVFRPLQQALLVLIECVPSFKLYLGLKKLISLKERKPCQVSMGEKFSLSLLSCAMWSLPNMTQQSGSNNENKYIHLTQIVCNLCSSKSTNHLKNCLLNSSVQRFFFKALKLPPPPKFLTLVYHSVFFSL